jgi:hypothetical protein
MQTVNHAYFCRKNMPRDLYHRLAFWWSDLGDVLLKLYQFIRRGQWGMLRGLVDGHIRLFAVRVRPSTETTKQGEP